LFGADVYDWLAPARSVSARNLSGGTGPDAVRAQLEAARESLAASSNSPRGNALNLHTV
jgi:argininosuccinate lyase